MTHIKVLYLKPNFSLEKVISAQFLLTSGNFFGNYRLLMIFQGRGIMSFDFLFGTNTIGIAEFLRYRILNKR